MSALISLVGLVFVISGLLSIAKLTDAGLNFVSLSKIHLLPFLNTFPVVWVYIVLGLILIAIAAAISRR
jgi:tryptophan-rich sensory protein